MGKCGGFQGDSDAGEGVENSASRSTGSRKRMHSGPETSKTTPSDILPPTTPHLLQ